MQVFLTDTISLYEHAVFYIFLQLFTYLTYLHVYMHARIYALYFILHSLLSLISFTRKVDKINRKPNEDLNKKAKCFLLLNQVCEGMK